MPPKDAGSGPSAFMTTVKMMIAVAGIFGSFGYFAILQEDLFKKPYGMDAKGKGGEKFKSTFFMMVAERGALPFPPPRGIRTLSSCSLSSFSRSSCSLSPFLRSPFSAPSSS
jgi:hypothetical protein